MRIGLRSWLLALIVPQKKAERIWQRTAVTGTSRRRYHLLGGLVTCDFEVKRDAPAEMKGDDNGI